MQFRRDVPPHGSALNPGQRLVWSLIIFLPLDLIDRRMARTYAIMVLASIGTIQPTKTLVSTAAEIDALVAFMKCVC